MVLETTDVQTLDVIETGGTIDMEGVDSRKPTDGTKQLLKALESFTPALETHRPLPEPLDSTNIGPDQWRLLLDCVHSLCRRKVQAKKGDDRPTAGIVIAHGTDTLQETALVMALEASRRGLSFPIVFTCAYSPASEPGSDALRNLVLASVVAQSYLLAEDGKHVVPPGVYVVVGNEVHLASRIKKVTTRPMNNRSYVESVPAPFGQITVSHKANLWSLDVANEVRLRVHHGLRTPAAGGDLGSEGSNPKFGYVEHLWFKRDSPPRILAETLKRAYHVSVEDNVRAALVLQGDFSRMEDREIDEIVTVLRQFRRGSPQVPVFTGSPRVVKRIADAARRTGLVYLIPKSLSHGKARTKLSWLLQADLAPNKLHSALKRDIAGECFEIAVLPDWIAGESYGPNNYSDRGPMKRVVIVYPGIYPSVFQEASASLLNSESKKRELNIVGFGDGNIPLGSMTVAATVSRYLKNSYGLELLVSDDAPFHEIETELSATIRYDERFRDGVLDRYEIKDPREMARHLLLWSKQTAENAEERWIGKAAESLPQLFGEALSLPYDKVRRKIEEHAALTRAFLGLLSEVRERRHYLGEMGDSLARQGLEVPALTMETMGDLSELGARSHRILEDWLKEIDRRSFSLLARLLAGVFARRIMKEAIANAHGVLGTLVRCVDKGVRVSIWTNAEMAATDTRKYEMGNFLLIAGVDSEEARGWEAGPLRLRS